MARRDPAGIRLITRDGHDWADRYPSIVDAVNRLRVRSCLIDGEVVVCRPDGVSCFDLLRSRKHDLVAILYAFDLIEVDGKDVRYEPIEVRKRALADILKGAKPGLRFNDHMDGAHGELIFHHACKMGLEGIISKRKGSLYVCGRSPYWLKSKNPDSPAARREAEEEWR